MAYPTRPKMDPATADSVVIDIELGLPTAQPELDQAAMEALTAEVDQLSAALLDPEPIEASSLFYNPVEPSQTLMDDTLRLALASNQLGIDAYRYASFKGNLCLSPPSLMTALSITLAGTYGVTEPKLKSVLHLEGLSQAQIHAANLNLLALVAEATVISNAVVYRTGVDPLPSFATLVKEYYDADLLTLDFKHDPAGCRRAINEWVNAATNGKIEHVSEFSSHTQVVIMNALYFQAFWKHAFALSDSTFGPFQVDSRTRKNTKLMTQTQAFAHMHHADTDCQVIEIPYHDGNSSMLVFLPNQVTGLPKIEEAMSSDLITEVLAGLNKPIRMKLTLPSFKLECIYNFTSFLYHKMDVRSITLNVSTAPIKPWLTDLLHKTFLDVNEEFTEGAAVTTLDCHDAPAPRIPHFKATHPFLFLIVHKRSNAVLFMGRLIRPYGSVIDACTDQENEIK